MGDAEDVRRASEALTDAIVANDAERIAALTAEEWRLLGADGGMSRARFLEAVRSGDLSHAMMRPVGDVEVRGYGDTALVIARVVNTAHFRGIRHDADEWTTDVYVRRAGAWLCVHTHITSVAPGAGGATLGA